MDSWESLFGGGRQRAASEDSDNDNDEDTLAPTCDGVLYRVVHQPTVAVRSTPDVDGAIVGAHRYGEVVTLYEWDHSRRWRKDLFNDGGRIRPGWILITHPKLGPLVQPDEASGPRAVESLEATLGVNCSKCGKQFVDDSLFCGKCGNQRGEAAPAPAPSRQALAAETAGELRPRRLRPSEAIAQRTAAAGPPRHAAGPPAAAVKPAAAAPPRAPAPPPAPTTRYHIAGTWNNWSLEEEMTWDGEGVYTCCVKLGTCGIEKFQIVQDADWGKTIYPDHQDAHIKLAHSLLGPDGHGHGQNWAIGLHEADRGAPNATYDVKLEVSRGAVKKPMRVTWVRHPAAREAARDDVSRLLVTGPGDLDESALWLELSLADAAAGADPRRAWDFPLSGGEAKEHTLWRRTTQLKALLLRHGEDER